MCSIPQSCLGEGVPPTPPTVQVQAAGYPSQDQGVPSRKRRSVRQATPMTVRLLRSCRTFLFINAELRYRGDVYLPSVVCRKIKFFHAFNDSLREGVAGLQ